MGNRRDPTEIPTKKLIPTLQRKQKQEWKGSKKSVDNFWLNFIKTKEVPHGACRTSSSSR